MEWSEEQRDKVARQFRNVASGWQKWEDLGCGDHAVLWPECLVCHRIDTVTRIEDDSASGSAPMWRCSRCDEVTPERDIWVYETSLLLDVTERPDCSPLVLSLLERCAHMVFLLSRGEAIATALCLCIRSELRLGSMRYASSAAAAPSRRHVAWTWAEQVSCLRIYHLYPPRTQKSI